MIAELFLIVDLLNKSSLRSTPIEQAPPVRVAMKPTVGSKASLGGSGLFKVGPISKITQPVEGVYITPRQAAEAYIQAGTGRPESISKRIETGRL